MKQTSTLIRKLLYLSPIFILASLSQSWGATCLCLCSELHHRGGETKYCLPSALVEKRCTNWNHPIPSATSKEECFLLGENFSPCKGLYKENSARGDWVKGEDGRLHTCRFF